MSLHSTHLSSLGITIFPCALPSLWCEWTSGWVSVQSSLTINSKLCLHATHLKSWECGSPRHHMSLVAMHITRNQLANHAMYATENQCMHDMSFTPCTFQDTNECITYNLSSFTPCMLLETRTTPVTHLRTAGWLECQAKRTNATPTTYLRLIRSMAWISKPLPTNAAPVLLT